MANKIQIKRSTSTAAVSGLANGELAYTQVSNTFWIGLPDGSGVAAIGGVRYPGVLTANQALVANATSAIDKIITANAVLTNIWANSTQGTAGQLLAANGTGGIYWSTQSASGITSVNGANSIFATTSSGAVTLSVIANSGILSNSSGLWAVGANGIIVTPTGINVLANNGLLANTTGLFVVANSGLVSNTTGVFVNANSGLSTNSTGVFVVAGNSQLISNSTGVWLDQTKINHDALTNFVANKHIDHTTVSISPGNGIAGGGDISATRTISVNANSGLVANSFGLFVLANSGIVANTTGVFVNANSGLTTNSTGVFVLAGNGIISNSTGVFAKPGTGVTVDTNGISIGQAVGTGSFVTFANVVTTDLTVSGNLIVAGTTTTVNTTNLLVKDNMIGLADAQNDTTSFLDALDSGFYVSTGNTLNSFYSGMARIAVSSTNTNPVFKLFSTATLPNSTIIDTAASNGTLIGFLTPWGAGGPFVVNSTAMALTANATIPLSIAANSLSLTTALPVTSGGIGTGTVTSGDLLVGNTGNVLTKMGIGTDGYVLQVSGTSVVWNVLDGGTF